MAKKRVADLLVDVLAEAGVRRIYGVPETLLTASPTRFEQRNGSIGFMCGMKRRQPSPLEPKPTLPESWQFVPGVAAPEICI